MTAVLIAFLILAPAECKPVTFYLTEVMPFMQWREAETKALDWLKDHPGMVKKDLRMVRGVEA